MKKLIGILLFSTLTACGGGGGGGSTQTVNSNAGNWLVDTTYVRDGGPGRDGIPSIDFPNFVSIVDATYMRDTEFVIGTVINGIARAYPHSIMNWHEIANVQTGDDYHSLIYCPLTGTASLWTIPTGYRNKTFGVSGKLYNSNIIPYDRESNSNWVQMLAQSVNGNKKGEFIEVSAVLETSWATWKAMHPDTTVLSNQQGFSRNYNSYPYGSYLSDTNLLFSVANEDSRLHPKARVLGINNNGVNKVYPVSDFTADIEVINENPGASAYVVVGSSTLSFAIAFSSIATDGTELTFTAIQNALPAVMVDNEGNEYDALGTAVTGARTGQQLVLESDFIGFWFAWVAIHPGPTIN